ncbi:hypothetical protein NDU88_001744 [Pleurodeles waltl]|uniref:Uncharacterized protein n=1 Tax=Pleurodeles waltl TaxID=8319 RepID=A0AAV7V8N3_PLEWA|nr:hypothetical protein NDU88_001744 [Pleurodeles waltl]
MCSAPSEFRVFCVNRPPFLYCPAVGMGRERSLATDAYAQHVRLLGVIPPGKLTPLPMCVSFATNTLRRLTQLSLASPRRRRR